MANYNRMTIRTNGTVAQVFKMKSQQSGGWATDMAAKRYSWFVSAAARPLFTGTYGECLHFIAAQGAEFMTEHGIAV